MTTKLDLTKEYKTYYTSKTSPEVVEFAEIPYEIYLSDPRRVLEEKWKTILRQPVKEPK